MSESIPALEAFARFCQLGSVRRCALSPVETGNEHDQSFVSSHSMFELTLDLVLRSHMPSATIMIASQVENAAIGVSWKNGIYVLFTNVPEECQLFDGLMKILQINRKDTVIKLPDIAMQAHVNMICEYFLRQFLMSVAEAG